MATLVLTALGSALGGPIGSALGSAIGLGLDARLFAPAGREGPRLGQLAVQGASYGAALPRVYGTMRVAGTLIWALDLRESRQSISSGKGRPKTNVYSYSASFAVALSARPAQRVGRIWADGKLLRGAAGDFKVTTGFRFYRGTEGQAVDPLIASAEGAGGAPAYRGLCYVVFEDLALESFGNRIPLLSFELVADDGAITIADIITDVAGSRASAQCAAHIAGYIIDGGSQREALSLLTELYGLDGWDVGGRLHLAAPSGPARHVAADALGAQAGPKAGPSRRRTWTARAARPSSYRLGYIDPARDYQAGEQRADLYGEGQVVTRAMPAALSADAARQVALRALIDSRARADQLSLSLPWAALEMVLGGPVEVDGVAGPWRIAMLRFEAMRLDVQLTRIAERASVPLAAEAGRATTSADQLHGPTRLMVKELPWLETGLASRPVLVAAAAGPQMGWRRAALLQSTNQGASWTEIGETAAPAIMGVTLDALPAGWAYGFDRQSIVTVALLHGGMMLTSCDDDALLAGRNALLIGQELIQFGRAERLSPGRYRLSRLLRGRRGTDSSIAGHQPGEEVLLIDRDALVILDCPAGAADVQVMASGVADAQPVVRACPISGHATLPLCPVRLTAERMADGALRLRWIRRSRDGWTWPDAIDAPLAEEAERYRIDMAPDGRASWSEETTQPSLMIGASKISALRASGAKRLTWQVRQLGVAGQSPAAEAEVTLSG